MSKPREDRTLTRRSLFIYEDQWDALLGLARQTGTPISHYVRQGIDMALSLHRAPKQRVSKQRARA